MSAPKKTAARKRRGPPRTYSGRTPPPPDQPTIRLPRATPPSVMVPRSEVVDHLEAVARRIYFEEPRLERDGTPFRHAICDAEENVRFTVNQTLKAIAVAIDEGLPPEPAAAPVPAPEALLERVRRRRR